MSWRAACALVLVACAKPTPLAPALPTDPGAALLMPDPDFYLVMQPQALAREGQALSLASAEAEGASLGLGTILVASERVRLSTRRGADGAVDVGMIIDGAPASMGPDDVVDERRERLLEPCQNELPVRCFRDRTHAESTPRRVYVLEQRLWFVAAGVRAIAHAEAALRSHASAPAAATDEQVVWQATYVGASLRRTIPKLRAGPLAPLAAGLVRVQMTKERRKDSMQVVANYESATAAEDAEPLASRVLGAWSRTREDPQERLVSLERAGSTLRVLLRGSLSETLRAPAP